MSRLLGIKIALGVAVFAFAALVAYAAAAAPLPSGTRTGLRGLKRQRALAQVDGWAYIEPIVRWVGMRVHGLLSAQLLASLDRQIVMAGGFLGLLAEELAGLTVVSTCAATTMGVVISLLLNAGSMLPMMTAAFGAIAPFLTVSGKATERTKAISRRLPDAIDLLALSMSAGLDFPGAVRQAVDKSGTPDDALIEELALILQSLQFGRTRRQALEEFAERAPIDPVREFVGTVVQAELRGNPLSEVLRIQAEVSRQRRSVRGEEAAAKAGVKLIAPMILMMVAILILIAGPMVFKLQAGL